MRFMTASARRRFRPRSIACGPFGTFVSFGSASGPVDAFNLGLLAQKGSLFATRPSLFTLMADEARLTEMAARLMDVVGSGKVKIAVNARYPLADAAEAHRALEGRKTTVATVLLP